MKRLMLVPALLLCFFSISLGQQPDQLRDNAPQPAVKQETEANQQLSKTHSGFVWTDGGLYMLLGNGLRVAVPGGGKSDCFRLRQMESKEKFERLVEMEGKAATSDDDVSAVSAMHRSLRRIARDTRSRR
jgi:hypothetical protein